MPRRKRIILPGFPHHITHRGNRKLATFHDDRDRKVYLSMLNKYRQRYGIRVYSYCLMTNHTHNIAVPPDEVSLSKCMHDLDGTYAQYFNAKYGLKGHLWDERFYACPLDSEHLWNALAYVEQNPVRAKMVEDPFDYRWSSARSRIGLCTDPVLDPDFPPRGLEIDWKAWLSKPLDEQEIDILRQATRKGIPYASEEFTRKLEELLNVHLLPRKPGRKPSIR